MVYDLKSLICFELAGLNICLALTILTGMILDKAWPTKRRTTNAVEQR